MDNLLKEQLIKAMISSKKMLMMTTVNSGVPFAEFIMLMHIFRLSNEEGALGGVRVMKIKEQAHISLPAVSQQLRILENKGLLIRSVAARDRRITLVSLTPAGSDLLKRIRENTDAVMEELVEKVGKETISDYIRSSEIIVKTLIEFRGDKIETIFSDCMQ